MHDEYKVSQVAFLKEFERKKSIARKAAKMVDNSVEINEESEPSMVLEEITDIDLAKQVAETLELQKQNYEQEKNPEPWVRSSETPEQPEQPEQSEPPEPPEQSEPPEPPVLRDSAQETIIQRDDKIGEEREEQIIVIQEAVYILGYDPLSIPDGGRGEIEKFCFKDKGLFTESGFRQAWDDALKQGLVHDIEVSSET
jgi:hypothetical protein